MLDSALLRHLEPEQFYKQWMQTYFPTRPDNRTVDEARPLSIQPGAIGTADGSSLVRLGCTTVVTGVKAEVSEGAIDAPDRGFIIPNVHFVAGANPKVRPGPPSEQVQSLTSRINECFQHLCLIDPASLMATDGLVWTLYIDVAVLNDDGNLWDAIWFSLVAALQDTLLPELEVDTSAGMVFVKEEAKTPLQLTLIPVPLTLAYYQDKDCYLVDPNSSETGAVAINLLVDRTTRRILYQSQEASRRPPKSAIPLETAVNDLLMRLP